MAYNVYHFEISNKLSCKFLVQKMASDVYESCNGGKGGLNVFVCVCVCRGDWLSEKLSGQVQLTVHLPRWGVLQVLSFQPCCGQN